MKQWFSPGEIAACAGGTLPGSVRGINRHAQRQGWRAGETARKAEGRGGGREYHFSLLPDDVQARLTLAHGPDSPPAKPAAEALWDGYNRLSNRQKDTCKARLKTLDRVVELQDAGSQASAAVAIAAREAGVSTATLYNWQELASGHARQDRLAALAPRHKGRDGFAACHPQALKVFKSDWLRDEAPCFASCYRRMAAAARRCGWVPVPSERALRRRIEAEIPAGVAVMARQRRDVSKGLYPAQRRDRSHLTAMQACNTDGHKFDVFCRWPDGRIGRPVLVGIQDLFSGKIVAWRLAETENKETVRLVIGDMVERFGIPEKIFLDNGRAFASKWITGGAARRFRFKIRDEDPQGLLTTLRVEIIWTTPYSGQSKPIERAWRDLAENISRHPACAGAYTGNRPDAKPENYGNAAIPMEEFRHLVAAGIAEHNARPGRRAANAKGRSFDAAFAASLAAPGTIVRWASKAQRSLWLLAAESIRAKKGSGEIELFGNRYWSPGLSAHAGKRVTVRFDPDHLEAGVDIYDISDRLVCHAQRIEDAGFDDVSAARDHNRKRAAWLKTIKDQARMQAELSADELARIYAGPLPQEHQPVRPVVVRLAGGLAGGRAAALAAANPDAWTESHEDNFAKGLRLIAGGRDGED